MKRKYLTATILSAGMILTSCASQDGKYTRGLGVYPGNSDESFAPELVEDNSTYRNVAKNRTAYHSSSHDYNLTAQLITDGLVSSKMPAFLDVHNQDGLLPSYEKEWLLDGKPDSKYVLFGDDVFLQYDFSNMNLLPDRLVLSGDVTIDDTKPKGYSMEVLATVDGVNWEVLTSSKGKGYLGKDISMSPRRVFNPGATGQENNPSPVIFKYDYDHTKAPKAPVRSFRRFTPGRPLVCEVKIDNPKNYKSYKIVFKMPAAQVWSFHTLDFYKNGELMNVLPSWDFSSAWMSAGAKDEWVYIDFGAPATYDKVKLNWINRAVKGEVQSSDDAKNWTKIADLAQEDEITLAKPVKSRYIRLALAETADGNPFVLSEVEVFGKGGLVPQPKPAPKREGQFQYISGGNWKLQRSTLVEGAGELISTAAFKDESWIPATVPGTVLSSYQNLGAIPDPNFADNQLQVSESFFLSNFWYRNVFVVEDPSEFVFLNFNGINWKANIFLNGEFVGKIEGAFIRGKFDVSKLIKKGENVLAVEIVKNEHPGAIKEQTAYSTDKNGGIPGADNPTFHASIGWDWIPTIRGRNIGIWNDVYLSYNGSVTIEDPFIRSELPLPDTTSADLFVEVTLKNHSDKAVEGVLKGSYGEVQFEWPVNIEAKAENIVTLCPKDVPALHLNNPKLWWPKGYGEPNLYDVRLSFVANGKETDAAEFKSGVRQMTFDESEYTPSGGMSFGTFGQSKPTRLSLYVNGRRFVGFGGNWGFGESNLNYRGREYDIAVAYHADMNFTMIRNWVGQIGDEEFYEACDRHGVMVWQDFWLANPVDGPNPYYPDMFNTNARDYVKRIRNHPSIGIYVGRNEGNPPKYIDDFLRSMVAEEHTGLHYISNSASGVVSGGGPYARNETKNYFQLHGHDKFHSERGMPTVMNYESLVLAFGEDNVNPVSTLEHPNSIYGLHDYTLGATPDYKQNIASAQSTQTFNQAVKLAFGEPKDAEQFAEWAQWINYDGYRAIFEGRSEHRRGMLLWMSHPAWPSMVWQTYDYYFDPNGSYFGCKKASEPIHIQWNPLREDVEVVNYHTKDHRGLVAKAALVNQDGKVQWENSLTFDMLDDQTVACFPLVFPETLSSTYFIKLTLTDAEGKLLSDNFYVRGLEEGNWKSLHELPKVKLNTNIVVKEVDGEWQFVAKIKNDTDTPALMIRIKALGSKSNEIVLPVFFSDNYFSLLPGEEKVVTIRLKNEDTRGEKPIIKISGFNII